MVGSVGLASVKGKLVKVERLADCDVSKRLRAIMKHEDMSVEPETYIRVLAVDFDPQGRRYKPWKTLCDEAYIEDMSTSPLEGLVSILSK
eukprot:4511351-Amphidinium_carterae.1